MESQQRETQTFATPSGKAFVLKTYLNAREMREIKNIPLRFLKVGIKKVEAPGGNLRDEPDMKDYDAAAAASAGEDMLLKHAVVSFDDSTENILERILNGRDEDYQAILEQARKLTDPTPTK